MLVFQIVTICPLSLLTRSSRSSCLIAFRRHIFLFYEKKVSISLQIASNNWSQKMSFSLYSRNYVCLEPNYCTRPQGKKESIHHMSFLFVANLNYRLLWFWSNFPTENVKKKKFEWLKFAGIYWQGAGYYLVINFLPSGCQFLATDLN